MLVTDTNQPTGRALNWSNVPAETVFPGITRQTIQADYQTLIRYVYAPGSSFPEHHHPQEQVTTVLTGQIEFTVAGQLVVLGPGSVAVIPPNVPHGATVLGKIPVETLNSLSPRRETNPYAGDATE